MAAARPTTPSFFTREAKERSVDRPLVWAAPTGTLHHKTLHHKLKHKEFLIRESRYPGCISMDCRFESKKRCLPSKKIQDYSNRFILQRKVDSTLEWIDISTPPKGTKLPRPVDNLRPDEYPAAFNALKAVVVNQIGHLFGLKEDAFRDNVAIEMFFFLHMVLPTDFTWLSKNQHYFAHFRIPFQSGTYEEQETLSNQTSQQMKLYVKANETIAQLNKALEPQLRQWMMDHGVRLLIPPRPETKLMWEKLDRATEILKELGNSGAIDRDDISFMKNYADEFSQESTARASILELMNPFETFILNGKDKFSKNTSPH